MQHNFNNSNRGRGGGNFNNKPRGGGFNRYFLPQKGKYTFPQNAAATGHSRQTEEDKQFASCGLSYFKQPDEENVPKIDQRGQFNNTTDESEDYDPYGDNVTYNNKNVPNHWEKPSEIERRVESPCVNLDQLPPWERDAIRESGMKPQTSNYNQSWNQESSNRNYQSNTNSWKRNDGNTGRNVEFSSSNNWNSNEGNTSRNREVSGGNNWESNEGYTRRSIDHRELSGGNNWNSNEGNTKLKNIDFLQNQNYTQNSSFAGTYKGNEGNKRNSFSSNRSLEFNKPVSQERGFNKSGGEYGRSDFNSEKSSQMVYNTYNRNESFEDRSQYQRRRSETRSYQEPQQARSSRYDSEKQASYGRNDSPDSFHRIDSYDRSKSGDRQRDRFEGSSERYRDTSDSYNREDPWEQEEPSVRSSFDERKYGSSFIRNDNERSRSLKRNSQELTSRNYERGERPRNSSRSSGNRTPGRNNVRRSWVEDEPPNKKHKGWSPPPARFSPPRARPSQHVPKPKPVPPKPMLKKKNPNIDNEFGLNLYRLPQPNKVTMWADKKVGLPLPKADWKLRVQRAVAHAKQCYNPRLMPGNPAIRAVLRDLFRQIRIQPLGTRSPVQHPLVVHADSDKNLTRKQKEALLNIFKEHAAVTDQKQRARIRLYVMRPMGLMLKVETTNCWGMVEKFVSELDFEVPLKLVDIKQEGWYKRVVLSLLEDTDMDELLKVIGEKLEISMEKWSFSYKDENAKNKKRVDYYYQIPLDVYQSIMGNKKSITVPYKGQQVFIRVPPKLNHQN